MSIVPDDPSGETREQLAEIVVKLMAFYTSSFPISAGIFSTAELLRTWREGLDAKGVGGPQSPLLAVAAFIRERLPGVDADAVAALLVGAAFQAAFLACFEGLAPVPDAAAKANALVAAVVPA
jgi:hypothetical protein